jgi:hypothetical protein
MRLIHVQAYTLWRHTSRPNKTERGKIMTISRTLKLALALSIFPAALTALAQDAPSEGPVPTTALITITSKQDQQLDPSKLHLKVNRRDSPITAVQPIVPQHAQVAILVDDGLRSSFALQLKELEQFINSLPPGTEALLGFMQNGTVRSPGFTSNHEALIKQLRIPLSMPGINSSPYFSLDTLVKNWPSNNRGPRMVLMLTNGVDPYNGRPSVMNQDSPYVQTAQDDAQRNGVAVYSIYFPNAGFGNRGGAAAFSGQNYLFQIAEATGGVSFNMGTIPPVSIGPYLEQFRKSILDSYVVSFQVMSNPRHPNDLTQIQLKTTQSGVKIIAPESVRPGSAE